MGIDPNANDLVLMGYVVIFLLYLGLEYVCGKYMYWVLGIIALLRLGFDKSVWIWSSWGILFGVVILFMVLRFFMVNLSFQFFTIELPIEKLKPGMIPASVAIENVKPVARKSFLDFLQESRLTTHAIILEKQHIQKLKVLAKKNKSCTTFRVHETLPFAPFLFGGALLTVILKGNILIWLLHLFV